MDQQKVWDAIAPYWVRLKQRRYRSIERMFQFVANNWLPGKILDVGCGGGRDTIAFAKKGFEAHGIDFSGKMIEEARKNAKMEKVPAYFRQAEATQIPFPDSTFKYAWCCNVISTIKGKENRKKMINEIYRILKPNGKAVIAGWNRLQGSRIPWKWKVFPREFCLPWKLGNKTVQREYYPYFSWELKKEVRQAGFRIIKGKSFLKNIVLLVRKN